MAGGSFKDSYVEIIFDVCHIWTWQFDENRRIVNTNCHLPHLCSSILFENVTLPPIQALKEQDPPLIISNDMGLMYAVIKGTEYLWVLGPVHTAEITTKTLRNRLKHYRLKTSDLSFWSSASRKCLSSLGNLY